MGNITSLGALDQKIPKHERLTGVLLDLIEDMPPVPLQLRRPLDPRARRLAELIEADPGDGASLASLATRAGASLRTLERCFAQDTGLTLGQWRQPHRRESRLRHPSAFCTAFTREFGQSP